MCWSAAQAPRPLACGEIERSAHRRRCSLHGDAFVCSHGGMTRPAATTRTRSRIDQPPPLCAVAALQSAAFGCEIISDMPCGDPALWLRVYVWAALRVPAPEHVRRSPPAKLSLAVAPLCVLLCLSRASMVLVDILPGPTLVYVSTVVPFMRRTTPRQRVRQGGRRENDAGLCAALFWLRCDGCGPSPLPAAHRAVPTARACPRQSTPRTATDL